MYKHISFKKNQRLAVWVSAALSTVAVPSAVAVNQSFQPPKASVGLPTQIVTPNQSLTTGFIVTFKERSQVMNEVANQAAQRGLSRAAAVANAASRVARDFSAQTGGSIKFEREMGLANHFVFDLDKKIPPGQAKKMMAQIAKHPEVASVEENKLLRHFATPNDPDYSDQWHYYESTGGLNVENAWNSVTGAGTVVAVLDTGYRPHADLVSNILPGYDMISNSFIGNDGNGRDSDPRDPGDWVSAGACGNGYPAQDQDSSWHGTHVAGTIAAVTNNGQGVAGVAYGAKVVPVRVLGRCGGTTADIADGIIWASGGSVSGVPSNANPADVINMSLGGQGACSSATQQAINIARGNGTTVVVASGNSNDNSTNYNPGNCSGVVNVAATNRNGSRAYYSNYGSNVDVAAPGGAMSYANDPNGVLSTYNSGTSTPGSDTYGYSQGTSMATPHVAGVAALIKEANPSASPDDVENILKQTARSFPGSCGGCGVGIVDANGAVTGASGGGSGDPGDGGATGGGGSVSDLSASTGNWVRYTIEVPAGMSTLDIDISGGSGDADLYVQYGSQPGSNSYDCRPYLSGNNESCSFSNPQSGTWHIGIRAYQSFSGVTLNVVYNP